MTQRSVEHDFAGENFRSEYLPVAQPRAVIIIFPTVAGISDLELGFARTLNAKGLSVFVADLYGAALRGCDREAGAQQMKRLLKDRDGLARRLLRVVELAQGLGAPTARLVAIGFCFGGLCALDVARSGIDIAGVASFHGLFDPPRQRTRAIKAKVIALHGWDDPMVPPQAVVALGQELTKAGCDWQILAFGHTRHAFTNPGADALPNPAVAFHPQSNDRAWRAFDGFLDDCLTE